MKTIITLSTLFLLTATFLSCSQNTHSMNIMTFNIRYDAASDTANPWSKRQYIVADIIKKYDTDIIGIQEGLNHQVEELAYLLSDYEWIGVGRDDGKSKGEYCAIFYKKEKFEVEEKSTFWLSKNPEKIGSKSWDAAITRITTWAKFKNLENNKSFYVFNTHFDHRGQKARVESAKLIAQKVNELSGENGNSIIMGDFNIKRDNEAYTTLVEHFEDTQDLSIIQHEGLSYTYDGFQPKGEEGNTIDYIFIKEWKGAITKHITIDNNIEGEKASDHLPVFVQMTF